MTALALALVVCCGMVCGTRLVLRGYDIREVEAQAAMREGASTTLRLDGHDAEMRLVSDEVKALRAEVESLRAQLALRSV